MTTRTLSGNDQKKVLDVAERIKKAIGNESPVIAAHACYMIIQLSIAVTETAASNEQKLLLRGTMRGVTG